jgi:hypothetical protein
LSAFGQKENHHGKKEDRDQGRQARLRLQALHLQELRLLI